MLISTSQVYLTETSSLRPDRSHPHPPVSLQSPPAPFSPRRQLNPLYLTATRGEQITVRATQVSAIDKHAPDYLRPALISDKRNNPQARGIGERTSPLQIPCYQFAVRAALHNLHKDDRDFFLLALAVVRLCLMLPEYCYL
jgi:hypothetical protein